MEMNQHAFNEQQQMEQYMRMILLLYFKELNDVNLVKTGVLSKQNHDILF